MASDCCSAFSWACLRFFLQAQEDAVSREDHEAPRQEVEKLRAEIDLPQSESGEADVLDEDPPRQDDAGRFAPPDTATEVVADGIRF